MRPANPQLLPIHVLRHFAVTFFGQNILLIFVAIILVSRLDMARIVRGQNPESEAQRVY